MLHFCEDDLLGTYFGSVEARLVGVAALFLRHWLTVGSCMLVADAAARFFLPVLNLGWLMLYVCCVAFAQLCVALCSFV